MIFKNEQLLILQMTARHEIKHDGFRIMARRDGAGVRLITRRGNDFTSRFPFVVAAVASADEVIE